MCRSLKCSLLRSDEQKVAPLVVIIDLFRLEADVILLVEVITDCDSDWFLPATLGVLWLLRDVDYCFVGPLPLGIMFTDGDIKATSRLGHVNENIVSTLDLTGHQF